MGLLCFLSVFVCICVFIGPSWALLTSSRPRTCCSPNPTARSCCDSVTQRLEASPSPGWLRTPTSKVPNCPAVMPLTISVNLNESFINTTFNWMKCMQDEFFPLSNISNSTCWCIFICALHRSCTIIPANILFYILMNTVNELLLLSIFG